jgi:hypothetical protein
MNINSGVAQARNSLLFRAFALMLVNLGQVFEMTNLGCERLQVKLLKTLDYAA